MSTDFTLHDFCKTVYIATALHGTSNTLSVKMTSLCAYRRSLASLPRSLLLEQCYVWVERGNFFLEGKSFLHQMQNVTRKSIIYTNKPMEYNTHKKTIDFYAVTKCKKKYTNGSHMCLFIKLYVYIPLYLYPPYLKRHLKLYTLFLI